MITDLKHKVNKEVLLRNVEIVEQAISTYLNLKSIKKDAKTELEEIASYIDSKSVSLPVGNKSLHCLNKDENLIERIKKIKTDDEKLAAYKQYITEFYEFYVTNFDYFLEQNFVKKASDKEFIQKIKKVLDNFTGDVEFYNKIQQKYFSLTDWQSRREEFFNDPDTYSYWRHDNLPTDWQRSALSDLQYMKNSQHSEEKIRW